MQAYWRTDGGRATDLLRAGLQPGAIDRCVQVGRARARPAQPKVRARPPSVWPHACATHSAASARRVALDTLHH